MPAHTEQLLSSEPYMSHCRYIVHWGLAEVLLLTSWAWLTFTGLIRPYELVQLASMALDAHMHAAGLPVCSPQAPNHSARRIRTQ